MIGFIILKNLLLLLFENHLMLKVFMIIFVVICAMMLRIMLIGIIKEVLYYFLMWLIRTILAPFRIQFSNIFISNLPIIPPEQYSNFSKFIIVFIIHPLNQLILVN